MAALLSLYVFGAILFTDEMQLGAVDYIDFFFAILALVGVFGFSFRRIILKQNIWKLYLPFIILWDISYSIVWPELAGGEELEYETLALAIMAVILLPQYIALFLYGFRSQQLWKP